MYNKEKTLLDELQNIKICLDENTLDHTEEDRQLLDLKQRDTISIRLDG